MNAVTEKTKKTRPIAKKKMGLYQAALRAKPEYKNDEEALVGLTKKFDQLAKKMNMSPDELFHKAEHSREFKEEYFEAISLYSNINHLKRKLALQPVTM